MQENDTRNYGIDLLRFVAMLGIVTLHILNHGGGLSAETDILRSSVIWMIEIAAYPAVNCYALISGYTGYKGINKPYRYWRYIPIYLQVLFYSAISSLLYILVVKNCSVMVVLKSLLPVTTNQYWYFTAFTGVFFLEGCINNFLYKLSKEKSWSFFIVLICFLLYLTFFGEFADPFGFNSGYSFLWLLVMYLLGAIIKKLGIGCNLKNIKLLCLGGVLWFLTWGLKMIMGDNNCFLLRYTSITIVGMATVLLIVFSKLSVNKILNKYIKMFTPCIFGIYLIHDNNIVRELFISNRFVWIAEQSRFMIPLYVLFISIAIMCVCLIVDKIRYELFSLLKINDMSISVEHKAKACIRRLGGKVARKNAQ